MIETSLLAVAKQSGEIVDLFLSNQRTKTGVVIDYNDDMLILKIGTGSYYEWIYRSEIVSVLGDEDFFKEVEDYRKQLLQEELANSETSKGFGDDISAYLPVKLPEIPDASEFYGD